MSRRLFILLAAMVFVVPANYLTANEDAPSWLSVMEGFSATFRGLERSQENKNFEQIPSLAEDLANNAGRLRGLHLDSGTELDADFEAYPDKIEALARALCDSAVEKDERRLSLNIGQLRQTCVSCHAGFRQTDPPEGFFPAVGNTVIADVRIATVDGQEKSDHSGVVIFLDGVKEIPASDLPVDNPKISQKNRQYYPRVLPIVKGTTVEFPNDDTIMHNVFSLSKARRFDLDVYQPGESKAVTFTQHGLVKVYCNIHSSMSCSILVLSNPYFAVSNSRGRCVISGIPDGEYTLRAWHEYGGQFRMMISVSGDSVVHLPVAIEEEHRSLKHTNKFGKPYRKKY